MFALDKITRTTGIVLAGAVVIVGMAAASWDILSRKAPRPKAGALSARTSSPLAEEPLVIEGYGGPRHFQPESAPAKRSEESEEEEEDAPDPNAEVVDEAARAEEVYVALNNSFEMDTRSTASAVAIERSIEGVFRSLRTSGARLESVECRSNSCRAVIEFADTAADHGAFEEILGDSENPLGNYGLTIPRRDRNADGTVVATMFVSL